MLQHRHAEIIFFLFRLTHCILLFIFQPLIRAMFSLFLHFFFATFYEIDFAPIPPKKLFHSKAYRRTPASIINDWIYFVNWNFLSAACSIECFMEDMSNMRKTIANLCNNLIDIFVFLSIASQVTSDSLSTRFEINVFFEILAPKNYQYHDY